MRGKKLCAAIAALGGASVLVVAARAQAPASASPRITQLAYLKASNPEAGDHFGCGGELDGHAGVGVAISADGNTVVVSSPHEASGATGVNGNQNDETKHGAGAVYVLVRSGNTWTQQAYLKASNPGEADEFGHYVGLSADGNTLAVSAYFESSGAKGINGNQNDESIPQSGAVYVFVRSGTTWSQQAYIKASNTGEAGVGDELGNGDQFGFSLTLSDDGNTVAVGAITEDSTAAGINGNQADNGAVSVGAVYVFSRTGTTWAQQAYVKPTNPSGGDMFGYSVSLSADGNMLAVGSFDEDGSPREINGLQDDKRNNSGAVYIFTRTGGAWMQQAYLKPPNSETGDSFGVHVDLSDAGDTLAVGVLDEDCLARGINPADRCDSDVDANISTGAVHVFVRSGSAWSHQAFIKSPNTGANDWFGSRLRLSGDGNTLVIAAALEDSAAQGLNGKQDDDSALEAGAVYLYTRRGTAWTYHHYVKGSNTQAFDEFGSSVAVNRDGNLFLVSARGEDSAARGLNGNQADESADEAGAVYAFGVTR